MITIATVRSEIGGGASMFILIKLYKMVSKLRAELGPLYTQWGCNVIATVVQSVGTHPRILFFFLKWSPGGKGSPPEYISNIGEEYRTHKFCEERKSRHSPACFFRLSVLSRGAHIVISSIIALMESAV